MARPINANAEETRQRVLQSACHLFAEDGVKETSVRAVARHAGVSLAMIHHYFGSKQGLAEAALAESYGSLAEAAGSLAEALEQVRLSASSPTLSAERLIEQVIRHGLSRARAQVGAVRLLMGTLIRPTPAGTPWRREIIKPFIERSAADLSAITGRSADELRLPLQSLLALSMRYLVAEPTDLSDMAGVDDPDSAWPLIEQHLVETAQLLLLTRKWREL